MITISLVTTLPSYALLSLSLHDPGACFSKVPKLFLPIPGATIPFVSSQRRGSKPSNLCNRLGFLL